MSLWSHELSPDGRYRYRLAWDNDIVPAAPLVWVMLNPSTATAETLDATMRRVLRVTQQAGYGALEVVNLFAYRSKNPGLMLRAGDPVGPENDAWIRRVLESSCRVDGRVDVVEAWGAGAEHPKVARRVVELRLLFRRLDLAVRRFELGHTKDGHPWHPLQRGEKCAGLHRRDAPGRCL